MCIWGKLIVHLRKYHILCQPLLVETEYTYLLLTYLIAQDKFLITQLW